MSSANDEKLLMVEEWISWFALARRRCKQAKSAVHGRQAAAI